MKKFNAWYILAVTAGISIGAYIYNSIHAADIAKHKEELQHSNDLLDEMMDRFFQESFTNAINQPNL